VVETVDVGAIATAPRPARRFAAGFAAEKPDFPVARPYFGVNFWTAVVNSFSAFLSAV